MPLGYVTLVELASAKPPVSLSTGLVPPSLPEIESSPAVGLLPSKAPQKLPLLEVLGSIYPAEGGVSLGGTGAFPSRTIGIPDLKPGLPGNQESSGASKDLPSSSITG